jgi:hypothetical protein
LYGDVGTRENLSLIQRANILSSYAPTISPYGLTALPESTKRRMSNVAKLKKRAGEFEQKKQFDKALAVYLQILAEVQGSEEESDVALFNREVLDVEEGRVPDPEKMTSSMPDARMFL